MSPKRIAAMAAMAVLLAGLIITGSQLFSLIPQVQAELASTPTPTPLMGNVMAVTPDPNATRPPATLKYGSSGEGVKQMQQRLADLGYYSGAIDGKFGSGTRSALKLFQQMNGLDADGIFGVQSSALLFSDEAKASVTTAPGATATPKPTATAIPSSSSRSYIRADGLPLLVNASNPLPDDYANFELVCLNDYCPKDVVIIKYKDTWAEREAVDALLIMLRAAQADGLATWQISSAYRTVEAQKVLFDRQVKAYMKNNMSRSKAIKATRKLVADPGCSEHHVGTCFDITVPGKTFANTKQSTWLKEHAWEYGFIQRYAAGKTALTGISNEAWHYRWVGDDHARIMHDEDLCLEEYIQKYALIIED